MPLVLCLDTEPQTIEEIRSGGNTVAVGNLGYRTGTLDQPHPPHEFEAVVFDLKNPACFDARNWGPGGNDNFHCTIVPNPTDETFIQSGASVPRFKLIQGKQIRETKGPNFDGHDVLNAVVRAGTHVFVMYNPEWASHVSWSFPNFTGLSWTPAKTVANRVTIQRPLEALVQNRLDDFPFSLPLRFSISNVYPRSEAFKKLIQFRALVTNPVDDIFGQVGVTPKGTIWILPSFENNSDVLERIIDNLDSIPKIVAELLAPQTLSTPNNMNMRDIFISHASEDKGFARPLAEQLVSEGISVWFDEYELKLGDSLRRKIEDGLLHSRHGLVLMSKNFFQKEWPQKELDALFSLETQDRRILPLWHELNAADIKQFAPLLADKVAMLTSKGIPAIVAEIKRVLGRNYA
jgi:hypothetical protein